MEDIIVKIRIDDEEYGLEDLDGRHLLAPDYDEEKTYTPGDIVFYEDKLYTCLVPTSGEFNEQFWTKEPFEGGILNRELASVNFDVLQPFYRLVEDWFLGFGDESGGEFYSAITTPMYLQNELIMRYVYPEMLERYVISYRIYFRQWYIDEWIPVIRTGDLACFKVWSSGEQTRQQWQIQFKFQRKDSEPMTMGQGEDSDEHIIDDSAEFWTLADSPAENAAKFNVHLLGDYNTEVISPAQEVTLYETRPNYDAWGSSDVSDLGLYWTDWIPASSGRLIRFREWVGYRVNQDYAVGAIYRYKDYDDEIHLVYGGVTPDEFYGDYEWGQDVPPFEQRVTDSYFEIPGELTLYEIEDNGEAVPIIAKLVAFQIGWYSWENKEMPTLPVEQRSYLFSVTKRKESSGSGGSSKEMLLGEYTETMVFGTADSSQANELEFITERPGYDGNEAPYVSGDDWLFSDWIAADGGRLILFNSDSANASGWLVGAVYKISVGDGGYAIGYANSSFFDGNEYPYEWGEEAEKFETVILDDYFEVPAAVSVIAYEKPCVARLVAYQIGVNADDPYGGNYWSYFQILKKKSRPVPAKNDPEAVRQFLGVYQSWLDAIPPSLIYRNFNLYNPSEYSCPSIGRPSLLDEDGAYSGTSIDASTFVALALKGIRAEEYDNENFMKMWYAKNDKYPWADNICRFIEEPAIVGGVKGGEEK